MKHHTRFAILVVSFYASLSCGSGNAGEGTGTGGGGNAPPPGTNPPGTDPPPPAPGLNLKTEVGLDTLAYTKPQTPSCLKRTPGITLGVAPAGYVLDGDLQEWAGATAWLDDPTGDAPPELDLAQGYVARQGEDLVIGELTALADEAPLYLELGGMIARGGKLTREVRHTLRLQSGTLAERDESGNWNALPDGFGRGARGAGGVEILLTRKLTGDVVSWPVWWIRTWTGGDRVAAAYLPTLLDSDDQPFALATCAAWATRRVPFAIVEVRDAGIEAIAERANQLVRFSFDAAEAVLGAALPPAAQLPIIISADAVEVKDPLAADAAEEPYRGLAFSAQPLAPGATDIYPEGPFVERASTAFISLGLEGRYPAGSAALRLAWTTALLDHLVRENLGLSYWLDRLGAKPEERSFSYDTLASRAYALGHLLGLYATPAELLAAWSAGSEKGLKDALKEALARDDDVVDRMWRSWVEDGPYDDLLGPNALADTDDDGLPNGYERVHGSRPDRADTDADGFSDLAEAILQTDPQVTSRSPVKLVPDGIFDDWLELLPKRLTVDRGHSGLCPKAADITFAGALATRDELILGAVAAEFWNGEAGARWEALIDFPAQNRQLLVTARGDAHEFVVQNPVTKAVLYTFRRAMPMGHQTIEWSLARQALGIDSYFDQGAEIKIRLRTVFTDPDGKDLFCDETDWFSPNINQ